MSIPAFDIQSLLPADLSRYYRYNGSLTTPPCHQTVLWTLFHHAVRISSAQVEVAVCDCVCVRRQWFRGRETDFEHEAFPKGTQIHPRLPQRKVLEQESEQLVAPGEQVGALHGFLHHHGMNVCVGKYNAISVKHLGLNALYR